VFFTGAPTLPRTKLKYLGETNHQVSEGPPMLHFPWLPSFVSAFNVSQILEQSKKSDTP
jgi:hypothetical protein